MRRRPLSPLLLNIKKTLIITLTFLSHTLKHTLHFKVDKSKIKYADGHNFIQLKAELKRRNERKKKNLTPTTWTQRK